MPTLACLFDTNVWMALAFGPHPHHALARRAFSAADSAHPVAFCRATQQTFLRLITTPAVQKLFASPVITNDEAWKKWEQLMKLPQVVWLDEPKGLENFWQKNARLPSASPKRWMDAYLAGFAQGHGISLVTLDKDLTNFSGLAVKYLLAPAAP